MNPFSEVDSPAYDLLVGGESQAFLFLGKTLKTEFVVGAMVGVVVKVEHPFYRDRWLQSHATVLIRVFREWGELIHFEAVDVCSREQLELPKG